LLQEQHDQIERVFAVAGRTKREALEMIGDWFATRKAGSISSSNMTRGSSLGWKGHAAASKKGEALDRAGACGARLGKETAALTPAARRRRYCTCTVPASA
jgi:hypothetical protein